MRPSARSVAVLALRFMAAGHEVAVADLGDPKSLWELVAATDARPMGLEDAARWADPVVVAVPFDDVAKLPADAFDGKFVLDATNHYTDRDGPIPELDRRTLTSEWAARHLPGARVGEGVQHAGLADARRGGPAQAGTLAESWRLQPGMPVHGQALDPRDVRARLAIA
jgi:predicted dinucleotide-binding enzyme